MTKLLNEVKNELASDRLFDHNGEERPQYNEYDFKAGWEACEAELIKRAEGRQFWVDPEERSYISEGSRAEETYKEFPCGDSFNYEFPDTINVIEMTAYNALQVKLEKCVQALKKCELYPNGFTNVEVKKTLKEIGAG